MKVHVTGGSGFLGRRVIAGLVADGHNVTALARSEAASAAVSASGAVAVHGDLNDADALIDAFATGGTEVLVNVASLGDGHARSILSAAGRASIGRAVFVSTTGIFTRLNPASKAVRIAAEDDIAKSGLSWTILRPTMIYGAGDDRNMARLLRVLSRTLVLPVPGRENLHQPVHVEDLAAAIVSAIRRPASAGNGYNVAGPEALPLRTVIAQAAEALGRNVVTLPVPLRLAEMLVAAYGRMSSQPRLHPEQMARLGEDKSYDISEARRDLAFDPRPFSEGIRQQAIAMGLVR